MSAESAKEEGWSSWPHGQSHLTHHCRMECCNRATATVNCDNVRGARAPGRALSAPTRPRARPAVVSHELEEAEGQSVRDGLQHGAPQPHGLRLARHEGLQVGEG